MLRLRSLHLFALLALLGGMFAPFGGTASAAAPQFRGLWVDAFNSGIKSPEQVAQLVADASRGGFNALVVQVRRRGDAYYLSGVEPRSQDAALAPAPYDPLATLLDAAHAQGIEVHAWIATLSIWKDSLGEPSDPGHVYWQHGPSVAGSDNWVAYGINGETTSGGDTWLDPGHPAVAAYTAAVARDLLVRYPALDGLHLDLVRYPGPTFGYNPVSVARFNEQYGREGTPDPADPAWAQWRRDQVTHLVRRIYLEAAAVAPQARVSAATIAIGKAPTQVGGWQASDPFSVRLQDWRYWLDEGIIDTALVMNYDREGDSAQRSWYRAWVDWETQQAARRSVVVGYGAWLNTVADNQAQIEYAINAGASGVSAYAYSKLASTGSREAALDALARGPFASPASVPSMPWRETTGSLMGDLYALPAGVSLDGATIVLDGPVQRTLRSDGGGWFGAVDLPPGAYTASVTLPDGSVLGGYAEVRIGEVAQVWWAAAGVTPALWMPVVRRG